MIEIAAVLSGVLRHWDDLAIILVMLFSNAGVRFWQEFKSDNAIALLKQRLAFKARVNRDGIWNDIEARFLVLAKLGNVILGYEIDGRFRGCTDGLLYRKFSFVQNDDEVVACLPNLTDHRELVYATFVRSSPGGLPRPCRTSRPRSPIMAFIRRAFLNEKVNSERPISQYRRRLNFRRRVAHQPNFSAKKSA